MKWLARSLRTCPRTGKIVGIRWTWWLVPLYPILGFLALVWFVVRVSAKPSRAAYPCQQASLALGTGFVVWLLGTLGILALFRWIRDRVRPWRRAALAAGLACTAALVLWSVVGSPPAPAAASTPTEGANAPIGTARGIYPGRVVWAHDAGVAHWSQAAGTHWWDPDQTDQSMVDALMSQGLRSLTGAATDAAAWDALFKHFNQRRGAGSIGYAASANKKIVVKINQNPANESNNTNYAKNGCNNENAITGSPHLIHALIAQLTAQAGAQQADITIYDASGLNRGWGGPRTIGDNIYTYNHADFPNVHFMDGVGQQGREIAVWPSFESVHYVTGMGGDESKGKKIVQQVLDAGFMINLAIMKSHGDGPTLCAKNHYGTVDGQRHGPLYGNSSYYSNLVELMGHKDIGEKTVLFLIDTLYGSSGPNNVPSKWAMAPFNADWPSSVLLSQDGVAIDSVGWDFLNAEFGQPQNTDYHLHDAAYIPGADGKKLSGIAYAPDVGSTATIGSLGVHEHWNNSVAKQYTRNLGTGSGIELVALHGSGLPAPWTGRDVGAVGAAGAAGSEGGVFFLCGSGADIWNAADEFHYVFRMLSGDGEIVARVDRLDNTNAWAKSGVMIRETLDPGSPHAFAAVTPSNGAQFQRRVTAGGASTGTAGPAVTAPYWVRLVRSGDTFTAYASPDGTTWTAIGSETIPMTSNVYIGLAVTSHVDATLCSVAMSSISVSGGATDTDADGMTDTAETAAGLDPANADQNGNGVPDGRDDWDGDGKDNQAELIQGTPTGSWIPPAGDDDGGGRCGLTGLELLIPLGILALRRRRAATA